VLAADPGPVPRTIRLEAIVTDKLGAPVSNLRASDFIVTDNGIAQKVGGAEWRSSAPPAVGPLAPVTAIENARDEAAAAQETGTRLIAVYLDEYHVNAGEDSDRVRHAVTRFIDEQVRPADLLLVMKPLDAVTDVRFTRDRDAARSAVASFSGRRNDYTPRTKFEEQYLGSSPAAVRGARAQIVMSGLRAIATRIGDLNAPLGAVVVVSQGFTADVPRARERRLPDLQGLVRATSRFRVLLYAFDPGSTAAVANPDQADDGASESPTVLQNLARQTGGDALVAGDDLNLALRRVSHDLDGYYVITFTTANRDDGRFHAVQIGTTRRDTKVRARSGYWTPLPTELRADARIAMPVFIPTRAQRRSPLIDSWLGQTIEADGRRRMIFTWWPRAATVSARTKPAARPEVVALKVTATTGVVLFEGEVGPARPGSPSTLRPDSAVFQTTPGRLQFDLTILAADGSRVDFGAQDIEVPVVRGITPVIFPPQLMSAGSAREFRDISADANAAPLPGREFRRTERLLLRVPTYEPAGNAVQVSAMLINRAGTKLADLAPMPEESRPTLSQFDLPLAQFAPGEYSIEVAAHSDGGTARELIRFKITG
jgi:VWFA-related protein